MKIVFISTLGAVHRHVVAETLRHHPTAEVWQPVRERAAPAPASDRWARFRAAPLAALRERASLRVRRERMALLETRIAHRLFGGQPPPIDATQVPLAALSHPATIERLRALGPDLLLVSGAPILKPVLFGVPRLGTVNLHYGVAPAYRGEDTLFWPLLHEDWGHLGLTLHFIDAGVDTGRVIAHGFPARLGGEGEADLWAAAARVGATMVRRFLEACAAEVPRGQSQAPGGRQYLRRERTALHDLRYLAKRALGKVPPPAGERILWY